MTHTCNLSTWEVERSRGCCGEREGLKGGGGRKPRRRHHGKAKNESTRAHSSAGLASGEEIGISF